MTTAAHKTLEALVAEIGADRVAALTRAPFDVETAERLLGELIGDGSPPPRAPIAPAPPAEVAATLSEPEVSPVWVEAAPVSPEPEAAPESPEPLHTVEPLHRVEPDITAERDALVAPEIVDFEMPDPAADQSIELAAPPADSDEDALDLDESLVDEVPPGPPAMPEPLLTVDPASIVSAIDVDESDTRVAHDLRQFFDADALSGGRAGSTSGSMSDSVGDSMSEAGGDSSTESVGDSMSDSPSPRRDSLLTSVKKLFRK